MIVSGDISGSPQTPPPISRGRSYFDLRTWRGATLTVLIWRAVAGMAALFVSANFPDTPLEQQVSVMPGHAPLVTWLQRVLVMPWMRYDFKFYVEIVTRGYRTDDGTASFHPLYPLLAKFFYGLTGSPELSLLIVSTLSTIVLCVVFARYVERFHSPDLAPIATWLLLLFPPNFIFLTPYTESTFFVFAVGCLWAMRVEKWWLCGLMGALATLTRQQGLALMLPLAWELMKARRTQKATLIQCLSLLCIPCGYAIYSLYRIMVLGEVPDASQGLVKYAVGFLVSPSARLVVPDAGLAAPWRPVIETFTGLQTIPNPYHLVIDFVLGWFFVIAIGLGWRTLHPTEKLYCAVIAFLALCFYSHIYMSFPRHMTLAFPLYIILAAWFDRTGKARFLIQIAAIFNLLLLCAFARHGWVP